jgi:hypothetical protein
MSYNRFCVHAWKYRDSVDREVNYTKERHAVEIMEVDWVGDTLDCVVFDETSERLKAYFFVSVLGYCHYPYVEEFPTSRNQAG